MSMKNFRAQDMPGRSGKSDKPEPTQLPADQEPEQVPKNEAEDEDQPEPEVDEPDEVDEDEDEDEEVPAGTTAEILQWVGGDPDRAQRALDAEQSHSSPRHGLTGELNKILSD